MSSLTFSRNIAPDVAKLHRMGLNGGEPAKISASRTNRDVMILPLKRIRFERRFFYACRECGTTLARVRAMKRHVACLKCCRRHNEGKYHDRFRFVPVPAPDRLAA